MDLTPLPLDQSGNRSRIRTLEFDEADAPMLRMALSVAVATAMMCEGRESVGRLIHYKKTLADMVDPDAKLLRRETDLCEIAILSTAIPEWTIHRVRERSWSDTFRAIVTIGTRRFGSAELVKEESFQRIAALVERTVDLECVRKDAEDVEGHPWR
jgi:hypothetical protein